MFRTKTRPTCIFDRPTCIFDLEKKLGDPLIGGGGGQPFNGQNSLTDHTKLLTFPKDFTILLGILAASVLQNHKIG